MADYRQVLTIIYDVWLAVVLQGTNAYGASTAKNDNWSLFQFVRANYEMDTKKNRLCTNCDEYNCGNCLEPKAETLLPQVIW